MSVVDPVWAGLAELSAAFESRALSPVDVVGALLARIKARGMHISLYMNMRRGWPPRPPTARSRAATGSGRCTAFRSR